jgi:hypothetical protein
MPGPLPHRLASCLGRQQNCKNAEQGPSPNPEEWLSIHFINPPPLALIQRACSKDAASLTRASRVLYMKLTQLEPSIGKLMAYEARQDGHRTTRWVESERERDAWMMPERRLQLECGHDLYQGTQIIR